MKYLFIKQNTVKAVLKQNEAEVTAVDIIQCYKVLKQGSDSSEVKLVDTIILYKDYLSSNVFINSYNMDPKVYTTINHKELKLLEIHIIENTYRPKLNEINAAIEYHYDKIVIERKRLRKLLNTPGKIKDVFLDDHLLQIDKIREQIKTHTDYYNDLLDKLKLLKRTNKFIKGIRKQKTFINKS